MFFTRRTLTLICVFLLSVSLFSQKEEKPKNAFGIVVVANRTADYQIQRHYPQNKELDVGGAALLGLEVRLNYQNAVSQKIHLQSAALMGYYSVNYKLFAHEYYLSIEQGHPYTVATYAGRRIPYCGVSA